LPVVIVAALQMDSAWLDPEESFRRARPLAAAARAGGACLLVLPEMFATGFTMDAARGVGAEPDVVGFLSDLALHHGVWVIGGLAESGPDGPRNACAVFAPDGREKGRYRKLHPFSHSGEERAYSAGHALLTLDVDGVRVTPFICYDLRFSEPFLLAADTTDLFLVLANWPASRAAAWRCLLEARAVECQAYVLGVNRVGEGDGVEYRGDSALHHPSGAAVARASLDPAVVSGHVEAAEVADVRERYGFLADRRPALYDRLRAEGRGQTADGMMRPLPGS
jgi:predicted amidohydrolase